MIPSRYGKQKLLLLDGFTFSLRNKTTTGGQYYCSSRVKGGCTARVWRLDTGEIMRADTKHNHERPSYFYRNGLYHKV